MRQVLAQAVEEWHQAQCELHEHRCVPREPTPTVVHARNCSWQSLQRGVDLLQRLVNTDKPLVNTSEQLLVCTLMLLKLRHAREYLSTLVAVADRLQVIYSAMQCCNLFASTVVCAYPHALYYYEHGQTEAKPRHGVGPRHGCTLRRAGGSASGGGAAAAAAATTGATAGAACASVAGASRPSTT